MDLCIKGKGGNVSTTKSNFKLRETKGRTDEKDMYESMMGDEKMPDDNVTFCFGQAVNKELSKFTIPHVR
jgi:hypothetical protein